MSQPDPGSFRDPASHVVVDDGRVLRLLDQRGLDAWKTLSASSFFQRATADGRIIEADQVEAANYPAAGILEHPRIPFISYPYEWTFSMLKDAARLQLSLLEEALSEGLTIKDATPFNIQFSSGRPQFIDIGSFEPYSPGEPWIGYRQFTRQFLYPLMLRAWAGVPFQPWFRGAMEGPTAAEMRGILPVSKRIRPSSMLHVSLHARMEERVSGAVRDDLKSAGFSAELILANVRKLQKLVDSLTWDATDKGWNAYDQYRHVRRDREGKLAFLQEALRIQAPGRVLDLGANNGFFSEVAAGSGATTIAVDADEQVLDGLYRDGTSVSIVLNDVNNPSPSQGWAGEERPGLIQRAAPELVIAYGLIHHLIYTESVPPAAVVDWLASFACPVVVEFIAPDDEMVLQLTVNKTPVELHPSRDESAFRRLVDERFVLADEQRLESGTRILMRLKPKTD